MPKSSLIEIPLHKHYMIKLDDVLLHTFLDENLRRMMFFVRGIVCWHLYRLDSSRSVGGQSVFRSMLYKSVITQ